MSKSGAPLGIHGKNASTAAERQTPSTRFAGASDLHGKMLPPSGAPAQPITKRKDYAPIIRRFALQAAARELLPREAIAACMRDPVPVDQGPQGVSVLYAPLVKASSLAGVKCCKSVWHCPVCAAKISEKRRVELQAAVDRWRGGQQAAGRMVMVTLTLQHSIADGLHQVLQVLKAARRKFVSGRAAAALASKHGMFGQVRALELTFGENGWHPHMHVLYFFEGDPALAMLEHDLKQAWSNAVAAAGGHASWQHGCDVRFTDGEIADYIAKYGKEPAWTAAHEVTKAVAKIGKRNGRTAFQLLSDYNDGDKAAGRRFLEYACNMKGERQLFYSHGLRDRLGLGVEKTDEQLAVEQEEIAIVLASLSTGAWRVVLANDARGELLQVASDGNADRVAAWLQRLGIAGA